MKLYVQSSKSAQAVGYTYLSSNEYANKLLIVITHYVTWTFSYCAVCERWRTSPVITSYDFYLGCRGNRFGCATASVSSHQRHLLGVFVSPARTPRASFNGLKLRGVIRREVSVWLSRWLRRKKSGRLGGWCGIWSRVVVLEMGGVRKKMSSDLDVLVRF